MKTEQDIREMAATIKRAVEELSNDHVLFGSGADWPAVELLADGMLWSIGEEQKDTSLIIDKLVYLLSLKRAGVIGDDWWEDRKHLGAIWPWGKSDGSN